MGGGRPLEVPLASMGISGRGTVIVRAAPKIDKGRSPYYYSRTPACSITCGAATAALGLSAGSPIGLLYDFPEVFFVPLGAIPLRWPLAAFPFRAPLGLHLLVAHHGAGSFFG